MYVLGLLVNYFLEKINLGELNLLFFFFYRNNKIKLK